MACVSMAGYVLIWPGTTVLDIDVGGLTLRSAESLLAEKLRWETRSVTFTGNGREIALSLQEDLGIAPDISATVRSCMRPIWRAFSGRRIPLRVVVGREKLAACISSLASFFDVPARDASFHIDSGDSVTVIPHVMGKSLDVSFLESFFGEAFWHSVPERFALEFLDIEPRVKAEDLEAYLPLEIIASYTTYYSTSAAGRAHNIALAASSIGELVIWPGETFSFNETVGPRTPERGYRKAPVIVGERYEDDYGGGVCQVSTTAYVAMLQAGFSIRERYCHGLPVDYVPLGLDATVAWDYLDLKMTNPGPYPCILRARVTGGALTVDVFGKRIPGLKIEVESRILQEIPAVQPSQPAPQQAPGTDAAQEPGEGAGSGPGQGTSAPGGDGTPQTPALRPGYLVETIRRYIRNGVVEKVERLNTSSYPPERPR